MAGTVNHSGFMPHIRVTVEEGRISQVEGGGEYGTAEGSDRAVQGRPVPRLPQAGYHFLNDATIGSNVKCFPNAETLWSTGIPWTGLGAERYRAGVIHFGFGAEHEDPRFVEFGRSNAVPVKHMPHVHAYFPTYRIKDRATGDWFDVVRDGWLTVLDDPDVRALAASLGHAEDLLSYDWVPAIPGINYPGDYQRDYATRPGRLDQAGYRGRVRDTRVVNRESVSGPGTGRAYPGWRSASLRSAALARFWMLVSSFQVAFPTRARLMSSSTC